MRDLIERQYECEFIRFAEWDGECEQFSVLHQGEFIVADSLALLLAELAQRQPRWPALRLAA